MLSLGSTSAPQLRTFSACGGNTLRVIKGGDMSVQMSLNVQHFYTVYGTRCC